MNGLKSLGFGEILPRSLGCTGCGLNPHFNARFDPSSFLSGTKLNQIKICAPTIQVLIAYMTTMYYEARWQDLNEGF